MKRFTKTALTMLGALLMGVATSYGTTNHTEKTKTGFAACPTITVSIVKQTNIKCNGDANGMAIVTAAGGISPYTYSWTTGSTIDTAANLTAGSYTVTATDFNGCTGTLVVTITQPAAIRDSLAPFGNSNVTCYGGSNGSARIGVKGGTGAYTYIWSPGGSTRNRVSNVTAGSYKVIITDGNGCKDSLTAIITQPNPIKDSILVTNVACKGGKTGAINTVSTIGGTSPYTYTWSSGATTSSISNLSAGSYTLTTRDVNFCNTVYTVTVTQPAVALAVTASSVPANCGKSDGEAYGTVAGGSTPYIYAWAATGGTQDTVKNLSAGSYTLTVSDSNGCSVPASTNVGNNSTLTASISSSTNITPCYGGNNGAATATGNAGTGPYTYSWSTGSTNANITNLTVGIYTVTITDSKGCIVSTTDTITQPALLKDTVTAINTLCSGSTNGSATATATGGTSPYTYTWSNGRTTSAITNLSAGTYSVTVTDNNGCTTVVKSATVNQPAAIRDTVNPASTFGVSCNGGNNGRVTIGVTGGSPGYTYLWAPGGSTRNRATGTAGTYTVTITDKNGCTKKDSLTITQPPAIRDSIRDSLVVACFGSKTGSASVGITGGTPGYTYNWSGGGGTKDTASNLAAGTYTVTIRDANNCTVTKSVHITQPATAVTVTSKVYAATCGKSNGSAMITASGGSPGYTYNWTPSGGSLDTASALAQGLYTCTVTDANGCSFNAAINLPDSGNISTAIVSQTNVTPCFGGADGAATIRVTGGISPYTYAWSPSGGTDTIATGLSAGTYTFNVTDSKSCSATTTVNITQPNQLITAITSITNVTCNGGTNGRATITPAGGSPGYTYSWSSGQTSSNITNVTAGTYTVTVTDKNGCTSIDSAKITQPAPITDSITSVNATCFGGKTGSAAVINVTGGTPGYTYNWSGGGGTNATASNIGAGTYTVTIRDINFCNTTANATITQPAQLRDSITASTNVLCYGSGTGSAMVGVKGGTMPYTYNWGPSGGNLATASNLTAGIYTITVTDSNGCSNNSAAATITQPATALADSAKTIPASCSNSNGSATVYGYNGTSGYGYIWNNGQTTNTATGLSAGSYTCTVTDGNGCSIMQTVLISDSTTLAASITGHSSVSCNGVCDGTATGNVTGGTGPYAYSWTDGSTTTSANALCAGVATFSVTDNNGCIALDTVTITQPNPLTIVIDSSVTGTCTNSVWAVVSGGTGPYTYAWNTGQTTSAITSLCAGTYSVTVTDANNCSTNGSIVLVVSTGIAQAQNISSFKIYPVPAKNILNISIVNEGFTPETITVFDMTGRKIMEEKASGNTTLYLLNVSKLMDGTYILKVSGNNGQKLARFSVVK